MFAGHVAVVAQVKVITLAALPANTVQSIRSTNVARDVPVTHP